jgi:flavorubredoxin
MIKIKEDIFWVGYIDWNLRNFHGYSTPFGSTYNAYLILDDNPTLIDTTKLYGVSFMLERIREIIDPKKIKYIISNHTEMDHSAGLRDILEITPYAEVICSPKGKEGLLRHFKKEWNFKVVNNGDSLKIGKYILRFFLTPMVHWPDSMVTYLEEEKILFSNDAFGQHYASFERFADQVKLDCVFKEATKYYANIVMPYGEQVLKVLETLKNLEIEMICPSHGLIWRRKEDIQKILSLYHKWASYQSEDKVVIIYDTMWYSTEKIAYYLYELLIKENIPTKIINLQTTHISDAVAEIMLSKVIGVGTSILNNTVIPHLGSLLIYLKGLKPKNRFVFTFGSYGWAKKGFLDLENYLKEAGMQFFTEGKYFQYVPDKEELEGLKEIVIKIKNLLKKE